MTPTISAIQRKDTRIADTKAALLFESFILLLLFPCTAVEVDRLVSIILPEADIGPVQASSGPEGAPVGASVPAPVHDGSVQQLVAELEALKASMKSVKDKHQIELDALKAANKSLEDKVWDFFLTPVWRRPLCTNCIEPYSGPLDHLACCNSVETEEFPF